MSQQAVGVGGAVVVERIEADTAERTREVGRRLGERLRAADLVILSGELGAGKTTFTQGLADGLAVRGPITSPTFVIARVHPSLSGGVPLVHVDAYRLGSLAELDDLDLDASVEDSVTVVEWGEGKAEVLSGQRLEVRIERAVADDAPLGGTGRGGPGQNPEAEATGGESTEDEGDDASLDPRVITVVAYGDALAERFG